MALVVWVYAGGGQAEMAIVPWLETQFQGVDFKRRTPQIRKPGPKPGSIAKAQVIGKTGKDLNSEIKRDLEKYWAKDAANVLLLLDDTDCENPIERRQSLQKVVTEAIAEQDIPCVAVALAVPELEVWLLADWGNTFQKGYPKCQHPMRRKLVEDGVDFDRLQEFDCRCDTAEYRKISETIRNAFEVCCGPGPRYSKDTDTSRLLLQTDPNIVTRKCPDFKLFWNELKSCLAKAS